MLRSPDARALVAVRLVGQCSDGVLQAALASLVLLSPERAASAGAIAVASAVLLLPFTLVGPWAAGVLDHLRRRDVLVGAGLLRALLAAASAVTVLVAPPLVVAVVVLAYLSVNRLLLAALSASLPRVVAPGDLVAANSVVPTAGSAAALAGGALALLARPLVGRGDAGDAVLLAVCALGCATAALLALRLARPVLGPDAGEVRRQARPGRDLRAVLRHLHERTDAGRALALIGLHRLGYGVILVSALLQARASAPTLDAASVLVGEVLVASAIGFALAAAATPAGARRLGRHGWAAVTCALTAAPPLLLALVPGPVVLVAAAGVLGFAAQGVKVCVDTLVQTGVDDAFRGRVFVVYDVTFNASMVVATGIAALVLPDDGWSPVVLVLLAVGWLALAVVYRLLTRRRPGPPVTAT